MIPADHAPPDLGVRVGTVFADKSGSNASSASRGDHVITGRSFAIKILHPQFAASQELAARFPREAKASAAIGQPSVVEVFDAGRSAEGALFLRPRVAPRLGPQRCDRLATSRARRRGSDRNRPPRRPRRGPRGIVHRDIKPENVFSSVDPSGSRRVKVLDFGIAKQLDRKDLALTRTGSVARSP